MRAMVRWPAPAMVQDLLNFAVVAFVWPLEWRDEQVTAQGKWGLEASCSRKLDDSSCWHFTNLFLPFKLYGDVDRYSQVKSA